MSEAQRREDAVQAQLIADLRVGHKVWFDNERMGYTVQARSSRYIVCTRPFPLRKTVLYTVIDKDEKVRSTENLILGSGAETREGCEAMVLRLEGQCPDTDFQTEISHRNRVPLFINRTRATGAHHV